MVRLYTWLPTTPDTILENTVAPDVGHSALEVVDAEGLPTAYASFWPERDSIIGKVTALWKNRRTRNPASYALESDPSKGFMQRAADHADEITGLDEDHIVRLWRKLQSSEYDFLRWNCASVCKVLILSALPTPAIAAIQDITGELPEALSQLRDLEELQTVMHELASLPFIDSYPDELRRIAEAYLAASDSLASSRNAAS